ncbi:FAD-binding oxidoreductase [Wenxinia saemankumensis]|nr:FAD-binding oxidoreductase [Wenxinia saemankumensis]
MRTLTRRTALFVAGGAAGWGLARASGAALPDLAGTERLGGNAPEGWLNDASLLEPTPVASHEMLGEGGEALADAFRARLAGGPPVNVGAARHSMGGHAIPPRGQALTLANAAVEVAPDRRTMRVHAGARWGEVIAALDPLGLSPKVMQSNNDFGVAATFCVNAHGWPVPHGPMGATVRSVRMVLPSGEWVRASREENPGLFAMSMGGYGLTGLITDLEVEVAENRRLVPAFTDLPGAGMAQAFRAAIADPQVEMAYGRLDVARERFFEDGVFIAYRPDADQSDLPAASGSGMLSRAARGIFRAQLGNEAWKGVRWDVETRLAPRIGGGPVTRNSLINEPVVTLDDRDPDRTDILHEYFVPPDAFPDFLQACRETIPASYQELLNVTLRWVDTDGESWLAYAAGPRIAAVMLFSQEMTARGEADMARMTRALIDRVLDLGGSYYLPYRPHATQEQFLRAYPRAPDFAARKRQLDPEGRLTSTFWDNYLVDL